MGKFHYRLPPCPSYDIEGIESWLSELAEKGLFLDPEGYVFGMFQFQKGTPRKAKYRLEPITAKSAVYVQSTEDPEPEALGLSEEFGWEYLGQFRDFYIYRSFDPNVRELNTDPVVQAMALDAVKKRHLFFLVVCLITLTSWLLGFLGNPNSLRLTMEADSLERFTRLSLVAVCVPLAVLIFVKPKTGNKKSELLPRIAVLVLLVFLNVLSYLTADAATPLLDILDRGWLWWILLAGCMVSSTAAILISYLHIRALQNRLSKGGHLDREKNWRKGRFLRLFPAVLPFLLLFSLNVSRIYGGRPEEAIPIENFPQEVPFSTIADLAPEREYIPITRNANNMVRCWSHILSPVNYDWAEQAYLDAEDGSRYGGDLSITYHEAANETIAKRLVAEYAGTRQQDDSLIPETIDSDDFDFLAIYKGVHYGILLRKGNTVINAYCSVQSWGEHENLYPLWLEQMAALLQ